MVFEITLNPFIFTQIPGYLGLYASFMYMDNKSNKQEKLFVKWIQRNVFCRLGQIEIIFL